MEQNYKVLLLADSRGYSVQRYIKDFMRGRDHPITVEVRAYSGATIHKVVTEGLREARHTQYDQVYLLAGVNNMTVLKGRKRVDPKYHSWSMLVRSMIIEFHTARERLRSLTQQVIICDLIALHLGTYNVDGTPFPYHQQIINSATVRINEYIETMNYEDWVYSPRFADHTHKERSADRTIHHRYAATLWDGLHYSAETTAKFSFMLLQNILKLRQDSMGTYMSNTSNNF